MKVAGFNHKCLYGTSNHRTTDGYQIISPPVNSNLDFTNCISYSMFCYHAAWITKDGHAYGIGDNIDKQISDTFPKQFINEPKEIKIKDSEGKEYIPISDVCGRFYSLYIVKLPDDDQLYIAYIHSTNNGVPIIVNIGDKKPVAIYGGMTNSAAITEDGSIIFFNKSVVETKNEPQKIHSLPDNEKAIYVACLDDYYFALSNNGKVYQYCLLSYAHSKHFKIVKEIHKRSFVNLTGSFKHALAVTDDGRVYGFGTNDHGKLGFGPDQWGTDKFKRIKILKDYKIKCAYAGCFHSLFKTENDAIIGFGWNRYGELFINIDPNQDSIYEPTETDIKSDATYCTVGDSSTAIFVGCDAPYNSPNQIVRDPPLKLPVIPPPPPPPTPVEETKEQSSEEQTEHHSVQLSEQPSEHISERSAENISEDQSQQNSTQLSNHPSEQISEKSVEEIHSTQSSEQTSEKTTEEQNSSQVSEQKSDQISELSSEQKSDQIPEKLIKEQHLAQLSEPASEEIPVKKDYEQNSAQLSEQVSKQETDQTSEHQSETTPQESTDISSEQHVEQSSEKNLEKSTNEPLNSFSGQNSSEKISERSADISSEQFVEQTSEKSSESRKLPIINIQKVFPSESEKEESAYSVQDNEAEPKRQVFYANSFLKKGSYNLWIAIALSIILIFCIIYRMKK